MVRKFILAASLLAAVAVAGCGHDAGIGASIPGNMNPEPPEIGGGVLAPNGQFVSTDSLWWRFASLFDSAAYALANVELVGPGVSVTLFLVTEEDVADGEVGDARAISSPQPTDSTGHYSVALLDGREAGECGLMLSAGVRGTLTRAFVYADLDQDLTAVSEAVVRSILNFIALNPSVRLCDYDAGDIEELTALIDFISGDIGGTSVQDINEKVYLAAQNSEEVQQLLDEFAAVP
jgi:hypothetical protein